MKQLSLVFIFSFILLLGVYAFQYPKKVIISPASRNAQTAFFSGSVLDSETGIPIAGVKIAASGNIASTNNQGVFTLPLPVDTYEVAFSKEGYTSETSHIDLTTENQKEMDFFLHTK